EALARPVSEVFRDLGALREVEHPGIVRPLDFGYAGPDESRPYQVLEYVEGMSLARRVREVGTLSGEAFCELAVPIADALRSGHERGHVHRDVKPANSLLTRDEAPWQVKILDFGLVRRPPEESSAAFIAPEVLGRLPATAVGPPADVYSFGRTCAFALLGT